MTHSDAIELKGLVRGLRKQMGLTLAQMGEVCGISKSQMHEVERTDRASLSVALALETVSQNAPGIAPINAADLNDDVKAARHGVVVTAPAAGASPGKADENSRSRAA